MNDPTIPDFSLVVLIGPSPEDRCTFAVRNFHPEEVISLEASAQAADQRPEQAGHCADHLCALAEERLRARRLTVVDAANLTPEERNRYVQLAHRHHALPIAVVLGTDLPLSRLKQEGFRRIHHLDSSQAAGNADVRRQPLWNDRRHDGGPFDIVGDVHGCADELEMLLAELGYQVRLHGSGANRGCSVTAPAGRKVVFVGDLVDRGPRVPDVLRIAMTMVAQGSALCVMGNHDDKFLRWLNGHKVRITHGLGATIEQVEAEPGRFRDQVRRFLGTLVDHYWLDDGRLCVAHAGLAEAMIGRASGAVRAFALYGETTGERDEFGLPVRLDWAARYRGTATVVYGHTPVAEPEWRNGTICLDTGCVFGGALTALRYPENELVSVPAEKTYVEPIKPFSP